MSEHIFIAKKSASFEIKVTAYRLGTMDIVPESLLSEMAEEAAGTICRDTGLLVNAGALTNNAGHVTYPVTLFRSEGSGPEEQWLPIGEASKIDATFTVVIDF